MVGDINKIRSKGPCWSWGGGAGGQNLVHLQKVVFLCKILDNHLSESIDTWIMDTMKG